MRNVKYWLFSIIIHVVIILVLIGNKSNIKSPQINKEENLIFKFVENKEPMEKPEEAKNIAQENYKTPEDKIEIPYKNKAGKSLYKHNNNFFQDMKNNWQFSSNKNESFFPNTIESLSNNKKRIEK